MRYTVQNLQRKLIRNGKSKVDYIDYKLPIQLPAKDVPKR